MGVDLILAGIYVEEKSLFMEKIVPVTIHKNTKKKKSNTFDFYTTFSKLLSLSHYKRTYINA